MTYSLFAMDTYFYNHYGMYQWQPRCEMSKAIGYDSMYLTIFGDEEWAKIPEAVESEQKYGIPLNTVYVIMDIEKDSSDEEIQRILDLPKQLKPGMTIELATRCDKDVMYFGEMTAMDMFRRHLDPMLEAAEANEVTISLYPHLDFWASKIQHTVMLCEKINHPRLKTTYCGFHDFADQKEGVVQRITAAAPYLHQVNLCGSGGGGSIYGYTIDTMDHGQMDNSVVLTALNKVGYEGPIGFQGYSTCGDAYAYLKRNYEVFRELEARVADHPEWSALDEDRLIYKW